jgi:hypothetical protein
MNLLKGMFTGSIGHITGVQDKGIHVVKEKLTRTAPYDPDHKYYLQSFGYMNKWVSGINTRYGLNWKGQPKDITKPNYLCRIFKPLIIDYLDFSEYSNLPFANEEVGLDVWAPQETPTRTVEMQCYCNAEKYQNPNVTNIATLWIRSSNTFHHFGPFKTDTEFTVENLPAIADAYQAIILEITTERGISHFSDVFGSTYSF